MKTQRRGREGESCIDGVREWQQRARERELYRWSEGMATERERERERFVWMV